MTFTKEQQQIIAALAWVAIKNGNSVNKSVFDPTPAEYRERPDRARAVGGGLEIMTKEKTKKNMDAYINSCNVKKAGVKGSRPEAWADLKALEILVKAARG